MADAKSVLDRLDASGLSVRGFALREGLNLQRLYRWRRVLANGVPAKPSFVEVLNARADADKLEVVLRSGIVVRVPDRFDDEAVRRLVDVLEGRPRSC